jgi:hypothetical protein
MVLDWQNSHLRPWTIVVGSISSLNYQNVRFRPWTLQIGSFTSFIPCGNPSWHSVSAPSQLGFLFVLNWPFCPSFFCWIDGRRHSLLPLLFWNRSADSLLPWWLHIRTRVGKVVEGKVERMSLVLLYAIPWSEDPAAPTIEGELKLCSLWQPAQENTVLSPKTNPLWSLSNSKVSFCRWLPG